MNAIGFLKGLIDIPSLSFQTGISVRTLGRFVSGLSTPSKTQLEGLKSVYANINSRDLQIAGVPYNEAMRLSTRSQTAIKSYMKDLNSVIQNITDRVNKERIAAGKDPVTAEDVRYGMASSAKKLPELFDSV